MFNNKKSLKLISLFILSLRVRIETFSEEFILTIYIEFIQTDVQVEFDF
jgi:hypothetical protein